MKMKHTVNNDARLGKVIRGVAGCLFSAMLLVNALPAYAIEVSVNTNNWKFSAYADLAISAENDYAVSNGTVTADADGVIKFTATGYTSGSGCKQTNGTSTTTMTLTNHSTGQIIVEFTVSNTTPSYNNVTPVEENDIIVATMDGGGAISFSVTSESGSSSSSEASVTVSDVYVAEARYETEFKTVENGGSYTVSYNGEELEVPGKYERTNSVAYVLNAVAADGCTFIGWKNSGGVIFSTNASTTYLSTSDNTVQPVFCPTDAAMYFIEGNTGVYYQFLDEAIMAAGSSGTIIVSQSGTAYHSDWSNQGTDVTFSMGTGVQLLVPYSANYSKNFGEKPTRYISQDDGITSYNDGGMETRNFAYCTLTIPNGSKLECSGSINVNGQRQKDGQPYTGVSLGGYGKIILGEEITSGKFSNPEEDDLTAQLIIKSGGYLYCYGYITGTGMVEVQNGGTIHELMQICDWGGGSNAAGSIAELYNGGWRGAADGNTLFLLSQFYVQSVEAPLKICFGATEYVEAVLTGSGVTLAQSTVFIGNTSGLVQLKSDDSYMLRIYDQFADRMYYHVNGECVLGSVSLKVLSSVTITSSDYVLPVNGSFSFIIESGSELTVGDKMALLPGAEITVEAGGAINVSNQIYLVEYGDFTGTHFYNRATMLQTTDTISNNSPNNSPLPYVATLNRTSPRCKNNHIEVGYTNDSDGGQTAQYYLDIINYTTDPVLINNGTVGVSGDGAVYSTASDGTAVVTGTGEIIYEGATAAGTLKAGKNATIHTLASTYGANITGAGTNKCFVSSTYYGQDNGYWYNYLVKADSAEALSEFTNVTSAATTGLTNATVSRYNSTAPTTRDTINNVLGFVSYYWDGSAAVQSVFAFDMPAVDGSGLSITGGGDNICATPSLDAASMVMTYGLSGVGADVTLGTSTENPTTVQVVASNASYASIYSLKITFPNCSDLSNFYSDLEGTKASSASLGGEVYRYAEAVAAIGPVPVEDVAKTYASAYMKIADAVKATSDPNTYVTVLQKRTLTDAIVVAAEQNITLDLGGKIVTGGSAEPLTNNGTLRLINGTITYAGQHKLNSENEGEMTETLMAATVRNYGTIEYVENVRLAETYSKSVVYTCALMNCAGATINEIRSGTFSGYNMSNGVGIINFGTIGTIGTDGNTVTSKTRRGIVVGSGGKITTIGGEGSTINIEAGQRGIELESGATVGTIGASGSTMNLTTYRDYQMVKSAIYTVGTITTIGDTGSAINITINVNPGHKYSNYGINVSGGSVGTIGAAGSTITIIGTSEQTVSDTCSIHGIWVKNGGTVSKIGASNSDIYINVTRNSGSGYAYGILNQGSITALAEDGSNVEIISNHYGVYNSKTIGKIADGLTTVSTDTTKTYYALYNGKTISMISGGYYHHGSGERDYAVYNPGGQIYPTDYTLSTAPRKVTLSDGTVYACYYVTPKNPSAETVTDEDTENEERVGYATLAEAIAAFEAMEDNSDTYVVLMQNTTETADITLKKDLYLDLNGKTVTLGDYTLDLGAYTLYGMDSTTNSYSDEQGYGAIVGTIMTSETDTAKQGKVSPVCDKVGRGANGNKSYITVVDENGTSFHRVNIVPTAYQFYFNENAHSHMAFQASFQTTATAKNTVKNVGFLVSAADKNWDSSAVEVVGEEQWYTASGNSTLIDALKASIKSVDTISFVALDFKGTTAFDENFIVTAMAEFDNGGVIRTSIPESGAISFNAALEEFLNTEEEGSADWIVVNNYLNPESEGDA